MCAVADMNEIFMANVLVLWNTCQYWESSEKQEEETHYKFRRRVVRT